MQSYSNKNNQISPKFKFWCSFWNYLYDNKKQFIIMKKIFLFFAFAGMAVFTGCDNDDDVVYTDNDTISQVIELTNVDFNAGNNFTIFYQFAPPTFDADVVLVYRLVNVDGFDVWQQIPRTIYLNNGGEVDYDFNFTADDVEIFMQSNEFADLNALPGLTQNQIFRIVRVPGFFANTVNVNSYDAVIEALGQQGGVEVHRLEN
ncbi:hypothetical protein CHU92_14230 [Flavobacterium cyanobacteriorum]|uniref:Uncharacterized protein n=2 Tax=Flavobacterium cyanobacteriorum TaxID=2022802 RepID=A0A255YSQ0_9FLAO|nr:hypothetical protein CHU92_14230 [Flavobacterium cyanobacteriorum]